MCLGYARYSDACRKRVVRVAQVVGSLINCHCLHRLDDWLITILLVLRGETVVVVFDLRVSSSIVIATAIMVTLINCFFFLNMLFIDLFLIFLVVNMMGNILHLILLFRFNERLFDFLLVLKRRIICMQERLSAKIFWWDSCFLNQIKKWLDPDDNIFFSNIFLSIKSHDL